MSTVLTVEARYTPNHTQSSTVGTREPHRPDHLDCSPSTLDEPVFDVLQNCFSSLRRIDETPLQDLGK